MNVTEADATSLLLKHYGISAIINRLPGELDCNFLIKTDNGYEYILKIASSETPAGVIDLQTSILRYLQQYELPFNTPSIQQASSSGAYHVRLLSYLPGKLLAQIHYHSSHLLQSLGQQIGLLSKSLAEFSHPAANRYLQWDLAQALWIRDELKAITNESDKACLQYFIDLYEMETVPVMHSFRRSVIHGDLNDYNILVNNDHPGKEYISGFIDFGDVVETATICELAIAAAYIMLDKPDPLFAAAEVVRAYHQVYPLQETEQHHLFNLMAIRLCISVVTSALRKTVTDNDYHCVSEQAAWQTLHKLRDIPPALAHYILRDACNLTPNKNTSVIMDYLYSIQNKMESLLDLNIPDAKKLFLDLGPDSLEVEQFEHILTHMQQEQVDVAVGRYNEARLIYSGEQYQLENNHGKEARTVHLGIDLCVPAGSPVYAPIPGKIHSFADNNVPQDYGPTIVLEHSVPDTEITFFTLYGHLAREGLNDLAIGSAVAAGAMIGKVGTQAENGGWAPHLHFQLITDILGHHGNFPGVAFASQRHLWLSLCPDPNVFIRINPQEFPIEKPDKNALRERRQNILGKNLRLSYQQPLELIRGIQQYLYDESGNKYLDCVNNVCHVGHCHPHVVSAMQKQMSLLNTNTRYLHPSIVEYAERLKSTLPAKLSICYFVNSGSEANELALRLARTHTGKRNILIMDQNYHGNTEQLINISAYKFNMKGGAGKPDWVTMLPLPDLLRQQYLPPPTTLPDNLAAFIAESMPSCAGQIVLPQGYLQAVYALVRKTGGVCIADEVQTGLGRIGTHCWAFESQEVIPDIVTMGKPLGNGFPLSVVVTTREIADSFDNGMEYFNSFGGNPVACSAGLAVLDVMRDQQLQQHARQVGDYLLQGLHELKSRHAIIQDVRGSGLFIGIELETSEQTAYLINRMLQYRILLSADGKQRNVIKIKPPMVFSIENADTLTSNLSRILATM